MSRMRADAAQAVREVLVARSWKEVDSQGRPTGRTASDLSETELARIASRAQRARWRTQAMSPDQLQRWSRQRRRARQTHPGKRDGR